MTAYVANERPARVTLAALLGRLGRLVLEALHRSRVKSAARELRRHGHLVQKDSDARES